MHDPGEQTTYLLALGMTALFSVLIVQAFS
jgi:hypothetical protein